MSGNWLVLSILGVLRRRRRAPGRRAVAAFAIAVIVLPVSAQTRLNRPNDRDVKAAYLLNFGRFTTWAQTPDAADTPEFALCVLGHDPFGSALDTTVDGETIDGRTIIVRRIAGPTEAAGCRIVFVGATRSADLARTLQLLDGSAALTVSDLPDFLDRGGMIQFVSQGNRIRFAVNVAAAAKAGLNLSSSLLRVAASVRGDERPDE
jgi:hypothetical protein